MVGTTGIEPVTPTMSTQCADRKYSEIPDGCTRTVRVCSCSDHGNLGHFLGAPPLMPDIVEETTAGFRSVSMTKARRARSKPEVSPRASGFASAREIFEFRL